MIGAAVESPARWVATVMLPADDPMSLVVHALRKGGLDANRRTNRKLEVRSPAGDVDLQITAAGKPGGEVSSFVLGACAHTESRSRRADAAAVDKLTTRLTVVTRSLVAVSSAAALACDAVAKLLLSFSYGMAFDLSGLHSPSGKVIDYPSRELWPEHLRSYSMVLLVPHGAQPPALPHR